MAIYRLAGLGVALCPLFPFTENTLSPWRDDNAAVDMTVTVTKDDLKAEATRCPTATAGMLEMTAILRRLSEALLHRDGLFLHAASVLYDGKAYAFTAPSGTGKTTHCRLWERVLGEKARILNGDKLLLRFKDGHIVAYGNPWNGKEGLGMRAEAELGGLFILKRDTADFAEPIDAVTALPYLMKATVIPAKSADKMTVIDKIEQLLQLTAVSILHCTPQESAVFAALDRIHNGGIV